MLRFKLPIPNFLNEVKFCSAGQLFKSQLVKKITAIVLIIITILILKPTIPNILADELQDIEKQIQELEKAKQMSENATKPLEGEVESLEKQISYTLYSIAKAEENLVILSRNIDQREKDFAYQYQLLENRVEQFYKFLRSPTQIFYFFASSTSSKAIKQISYQKSVAQKDKEIILKISKDLSNLETDKEKLEQSQITLKNLKERLASQQEFFQEEISKAKDYQKTLGEQIQQLSAKQKELLAAKTGNFATSVGEVPAADDPASRPDYNPGFSPAFATFSFGAPHFKGMSQYGALGRAKEGQSYEQILKAYYGDIRVEEVDTNFDLPTTSGNLNFEGNYLLGIAEMPTSWADKGGMEALKAQAIAARSYALGYVGWRMGDRNTKKPICTTESCQVYNSGKAGNPGQWREAVEATKGKIVVGNSSNEIVNTWYAASSGGYQESYSSLNHSTPGFWDTKNGYQGWTSEAFEKIGGSPWFYKAWYKTRSGLACSRSHPWLNMDEFTDIVNSAYLYEKNESYQIHLSQEDAACYGKTIEDTWSKSRVREEMRSHGGAITNISSLSVLYSQNGTTSQVTFNTNRGSIQIDGQKFYKIFNLRAPGAVHLKSGLFNIEQK